MSILDKVRRWIDGETSELVLEQAAKDAQIKPRSKAEEFIVKIARSVEKVMQDEMVPLPQGTTIIPSEYTIFLSSEDDKEWQGAKRKGLEQGLYHILAERAKEIAGRKKLETRSFVIELRIDGTLDQGEIRIQHGWEDPNTNKTGVLARPKNMPTLPTPLAQRPPALPTDPIIKSPTARPAQFQTPEAQALSGSPIQQAVPIPPEEGEEMTHVNSRHPELYKLEIWRAGVRQNVVPIFQKEIMIGRGSKSKPVDIPLVGDVEVSRRHLTLATDGAGNFWAVNEGKNAPTINNYELPAGQRVTVTIGIPLNICTYMLRIQPK
ncbi:MAG: FhaA domain-containing protein [Pyrinomonadaceae bacterium]